MTLEKQLQASVDYQSEKWLQESCIPSDMLPTDEQLAEAHRRIERTCFPLPMPESACQWWGTGGPFCMCGEGGE